MTIDPEWWKSAVVYQIYPRSFLDTNGDGIGDLNGITQKLDYLNNGTPNSLGVDALWINPFYLCPQYDFGYDVQDYRKVDPQYGTMEDFERLLVEAHKRGIKIIMDMVPNHTSHLHPWFLESRSSKTNPKRDWYFWRKAPKPGKYPNNWLGVFGGGAWEWDNKTKEYYYHDSLLEQPDLNWRNPEVAKAVLGEMAFWFDKGVDGFRIDVINYTGKDEQLRSNPYCPGRRPYDMQRHIYDKDGPGAVEVAKKMRALADKYPNRMLVGEVYVNNPNVAARYLGDGDGLNMAFNFAFMYCRFRAERFKQQVETWEAAVGNKGWPAYFLSNHDHRRHISRYAKGKWTEARARVAAAMLLTLRGTPFIYYGEEIGMRNLWLRKHEIMDPPGKKYWPFFPSRDNARTPMQWDSSINAGFSPAEPWLRAHPNHAALNVKAQESDSDSLLSFYRKIIWTRKRNPALQTGTLAFNDAAPEHVLSFFREHSGQRILVCLNYSNRAISFSVAGKPEHAKNVFSYPQVAESVDMRQIQMAPYGILIAKA